MGKVTGSPARELKGDLQQEAGQTRKDVGDIEEAAKDSAKRGPRNRAQGRGVGTVTRIQGPSPRGPQRASFLADATFAQGCGCDGRP